MDKKAAGGPRVFRKVTLDIGYGTFRQVYSPTRDIPTREDRSDKYSPTRGQILPANSLFDIVIFFGGYWASDNIETLHM